MLHSKDFYSLTNALENPYAPFAGKVVVVVGKGDSGKTIMEFLTRPNGGPNTDAYGPDDTVQSQFAKTVWVGVPWATQREYETNNRARYRPLGAKFPKEATPYTFDPSTSAIKYTKKTDGDTCPLILPIKERLGNVGSIRDLSGGDGFKVTVELFGDDGCFKGKLDADIVIFATSLKPNFRLYERLGFKDAGPAGGGLDASLARVPWRTVRRDASPYAVLPGKKLNTAFDDEVYFIGPGCGNFFRIPAAGDGCRESEAAKKAAYKSYIEPRINSFLNDPKVDGTSSLASGAYKLETLYEVFGIGENVVSIFAVGPISSSTARHLLDEFRLGLRNAVGAAAGSPAAAGNSGGSMGPLYLLPHETCVCTADAVGSPTEIKLNTGKALSQRTEAISAKKLEKLVSQIARTSRNLEEFVMLRMMMNMSPISAAEGSAPVEVAVQASAFGDSSDWSSNYGEVMLKMAGGSFSGSALILKRVEQDYFLYLALRHMIEPISDGRQSAGRHIVEMKITINASGVCGCSIAHGDGGGGGSSGGGGGGNGGGGGGGSGSVTVEDVLSVEQQVFLATEDGDGTIQKAIEKFLGLATSNRPKFEQLVAGIIAKYQSSAAPEVSSGYGSGSGSSSGRGGFAHGDGGGGGGGGDGGSGSGAANPKPADTARPAASESAAGSTANYVSRPVAKWSISDVLEWATNAHLHFDMDLLKSAELYGPDLLEIDDTDLQTDFGVASKLQRKKILRMLGELKEKGGV